MLENASGGQGATDTAAGWPYEPSAGTGSEPSTHLRVLDQISHAFASAADAEEAYAGTTRWVREALGDDKATVRIVLSDKHGRLRLAFSDGESRAALRTAHAKREEVFRTKRPGLLVLAPSRSAVLRIPLVSRGESVGVLEVVTDKEELTPAIPTLQAVASQAAIAFSNLRHRTELAREIAIRGSLAALSHQLLGARSREAALETAAKFCAEQLSVPTGAWIFTGDDRGMRLVTARAVERGKAELLDSEMRWIPHWDSLPSGERQSLLSAFASLAGADDVSEVSVGDVLFLAGGTRSELLAVVQGLLEEILTHLASVGRARKRNEQLDLALAWTAHEFRGPLLGVKAMVEQLLAAGEDPASNHDTLENLHSELEELAALVEPVLQWAAGAVPLQRRRTDLVRLVREAAGSAGGDELPIGIAGADRMTASVDANHLRTAISNLIRNAMAYSPSGTRVEMTIRADGEDAIISVADRGPGVPPSERETIFDPFMRGKVGQTTRFGRGLGLFIARRVVEAHEGRIWVESPDGEGAIFHVAIPTR